MWLLQFFGEIKKPAIKTAMRLLLFGRWCVKIVIFSSEAGFHNFNK